VERILAGTPILARRPSAVERIVKFSRRRPWTTLAAVLLVVIVIGAIAVVAASRQRLAEETVAQRELITETIDDVLDVVSAFIGSESAREKVIDRMLVRTDALLRATPDDPDLLLTRARLLRALGYLHADRSHGAAMLSVCREVLAIYDRLAPGREGDVEFVRAHVEAIVRVGDAVAENRRATDPEWRGPITEVGEYYARARAMLLDARSRRPDHIGLWDDVCCSCVRMLGYEGTADLDRRILECVELAEALLAASPDRDLSKFALSSAHRHAFMHLSKPRAHPERPGIIDVRRRHAAEALRLSRELVRSQPQRGAFLMDHFANLSAVIHLSAEIPEVARDAHALCTELEGLVRRMGPEQWSRVDLQAAATSALAVLLRKYRQLNLADQERGVARLFAAVAADPAISWTPNGRDLFDHWMVSLREEGFLPDDMAAPANRAEAAGARE